MQETRLPFRSGPKRSVCYRPARLRPPATGDVPYPTGVGVLLFGGRGNVVSNNRIFGNWSVGAGMLEQFLLKNAVADGTLIGVANYAGCAQRSEFG